MHLPVTIIQDFPMPKGVNLSFFRDATEYNPRAGDIFIVSYPKCGTTWMQHIVYLLHNKGVPAKDVSEILNTIPFVEQDGFLDAKERHIALKYHLPYRLIPKSEEAKYIYIARNPKDSCVSYYHFLRGLPGYKIESFDDFFEDFLSGELPYGEFVDHVMEWYEHRHLPNILFITYESLAEDRKTNVEKIANFLGFQDLDENTLQGVLRHSEFNFMRNFVDGSAYMQKYLKNSTHIEAETDPKFKPRMMRKGLVGDWKNHFSKQQSDRMNIHFQQKTEGTDLRTLWEDHL